jgi:NTP pyrophosphatase (non-canonical NTP hydrolase)
MEIKELQKKADEIIEMGDKNFKCEHNLENTVFHFIEEVGELISELGKPKFRNQKIDEENLEKEIVDVLIFLMRIANLNNIDVEKAFNNKINELKQRWNL